MNGEKNANEDVLALVLSVKEGKPGAFEELLEQYSPLIERSIHNFSQTTALAGEEKEDLRQDAALCLFNAALRFDVSQTAVTFGLYAKICIRNKLISTLRHIERQKRKKKPIKQEQSSFNGFDHMAYKDLLKEADRILSKKEKTVLNLYLSGVSYKEAAEELGTTIKSIDNALSRAKRKLRGSVKRNDG